MPDSSVATKTEQKLKMPSQWRIIMHNDHFTPFPFVIQLLMEVFHKPMDEAERLALLIHEQGKAQIGLYTKEVAKTKEATCTELARLNNHPLKVTAEEA